MSFKIIFFFQCYKHRDSVKGLGFYANLFTCAPQGNLLLHNQLHNPLNSHWQTFWSKARDPDMFLYLSQFLNLMIIFIQSLFSDVSYTAVR